MAWVSPPPTVTADAVFDAFTALGIDPIGVHGIHINRIDGTVVVDRLVTKPNGAYMIVGAKYVTESHTLDVI